MRPLRDALLFALLLTQLAARARGGAESDAAAAAVATQQAQAAIAAEATPPFSALAEADQLTTELAELVQAPCGGYAHTFRAEREGADAVLAALRVARFAACAEDGRHCGAADDEAAGDADAAAWTRRVQALQARWSAGLFACASAQADTLRRRCCTSAARRRR